MESGFINLSLNVCSRRNGEITVVLFLLNISSYSKKKSSSYERHRVQNIKSNAINRRDFTQAGYEADT